jgi:hypothetical protein
VKVTIYASTNKERENNIAQALSAGFKRHGDVCETLPTQDYSMPKGDTQVAVMVGLKGKSKQIYEDHRRAGRAVLLVDKSYFARSEYVRFGLDGFQSPYLNSIKQPPDRFNALKIEVKPKRKHSKHIIYAGSSQKYCNWHDLGDASDYAGSWCHTINKLKSRHDITHMPIYYRPKPSWAALHPEDVRKIGGTIYSGPDETLPSLLEGCHVLFTHGSNAAVEAMLNGVPVMLISSEGASAVWSIADANMDHIADPHWPTDEERLQLFYNLAYWQFNTAEMTSGLAWENLQRHTVKGLAKASGTEAENTIELYKMMHRGPKMFRGGSMKGHIEAVGQLIGKYEAKSLLDYGSGKGAQYDEMKLHERWGGLKPTCYDPGYEPLSKKPEGRFDGVVCTDVAEHVPESGVDEFIRTVVGYADRFAFFCIFTEPSRKYLPDGRNCHVTVRSPEWWLDRACRVLGYRNDHSYSIRKPLPGGGFQEFRHYVLTGVGPDVIVTFRGEE